MKDKSKSQKLTKAKGDKKIPESGALSMKKSLQKLKDTDPEFYEFLKAEDKSLLEFDDEAFEEDVDQADDLDIDEDHVQYSRGIKERKNAKAFEKAILDMSSGESEGSDEDDAQEDDDKGRRHKLPSKLEASSFFLFFRCEIPHEIHDLFSTILQHSVTLVNCLLSKPHDEKAIYVFAHMHAHMHTDISR